MDNQINFICEHWLKNGEFYNVAQKFSDKWVALKSSMDPSEIINGRPYGGIGFICSKSEGITFQSIDVESDRICAIQLSMNRKVLINVIGVYLPYNSGTSECMELYLDTLDKIRSVIDQHVEAPSILIGDMNTSLPQLSTLNQNWYKTKPYNMRSVMLYDLM